MLQVEDGDRKYEDIQPGSRVRFVPDSDPFAEPSFLAKCSTSGSMLLFEDLGHTVFGVVEEIKIVESLRAKQLIRQFRVGIGPVGVKIRNTDKVCMEVIVRRKYIVHFTCIITYSKS